MVDKKDLVGGGDKPTHILLGHHLLDNRWFMVVDSSASSVHNKMQSLGNWILAGTLYGPFFDVFFWGFDVDVSSATRLSFWSFAAWISDPTRARSFINFLVGVVLHSSRCPYTWLGRWRLGRFSSVLVILSTAYCTISGWWWLKPCNFMIFHILGIRIPTD